MPYASNVVAGLTTLMYCSALQLCLENGLNVTPQTLQGAVVTLLRGFQQDNGFPGTGQGDGAAQGILFPELIRGSLGINLDRAGQSIISDGQGGQLNSTQMETRLAQIGRDASV